MTIIIPKMNNTDFDFLTDIEKEIIQLLEKEPTELSTKKLNEITDILKDATKNFKSNSNPLVDHLYEKMEDEILAMYISKFSVLLPIKIGNKIINCLIDTGAQANIISEKLVKELQLEEYVDKNVKGTLVGTGKAEISGFIPYMNIQIENMECSICATVSNLATKTGMILGISFLSCYGACLDFKSRKILINGKSVSYITNET